MTSDLDAETSQPKEGGGGGWGKTRMSCLKARVRAKSISGAWHVQRYPTLKKHCMTNISLTAHETCTPADTTHAVRVPLPT